MTLDITNLQIDSASPEGQVIEDIITRDQVIPGEAVLRALRDIAGPSPRPTTRPGELLFGLFADEPALIQRIAKEARGARGREAVKEFSA